VRETALRQEFGLSTEDAYALASIAVDFRVAGAVDSVQNDLRMISKKADPQQLAWCGNSAIRFLSRRPDFITLLGDAWVVSATIPYIEPCC
jgi:hypothetical protein